MMAIIGKWGVDSSHVVCAHDLLSLIDCDLKWAVATTSGVNKITFRQSCTAIDHQPRTTVVISLQYGLSRKREGQVEGAQALIEGQRQASGRIREFIEESSPIFWGGRFGIC